MTPPPRTLIWLALAAALLSGLSSGALFLKSSRDLQGTEYGRPGGSPRLPDPALPPRPPLLAVNADLAGGDDPQGTAAAVRAAGFDWVRQPFRWADLEPRPGDLRWAAADAVVQAAAAHSLRLIAVLLAAPDWSHPANPRSTAPPDDPGAFARFAAAFAARYGARTCPGGRCQGVEVYQVWDEPNLASAWGDRDPSPAGYAALLQAGYDAIHAAHPGATVLAAGLAPTAETGPANLSDLLFLDELYRLGAGAYFDGASGKPYGFSAPPEDRRADPALAALTALDRKSVV